MAKKPAKNKIIFATTAVVNLSATTQFVEVN